MSYLLGRIFRLGAALIARGFGDDGSDAPPALPIVSVCGEVEIAGNVRGRTALVGNVAGITSIAEASAGSTRIAGNVTGAVPISNC